MSEMRSQVIVWLGRTFAPAATAFLMRSWHWVRLWDMEPVEQSWPTALVAVV